MSTRYRIRALLFFAVAAMVLLPACGEHGQDHDGAGADHGQNATAEAMPAAGPIEVGQTALAVLAVADATDGTTDHVVAKCTSCALHMDGSAEHTVQVGDYELHFCSAHCRDAFAENAETALLALSLPEGEAGKPAEGHP